MSDLVPVSDHPCAAGFLGCWCVPLFSVCTPRFAFIWGDVLVASPQIQNRLLIKIGCYTALESRLFVAREDTA